MEIDIVFRIAAVGILVAVLNQVLIRAGRAGGGAVLGHRVYQPPL